MRICVIANENAGSGERAEALRAAVEARPGAAWWPSRKRGDAVDLAERAAAEAFDVVAAAGGDGTINEVVNGLMRREARPVLGVIALGTGNDLARMLAVPVNDPRASLALLVHGARQALDVFRMRSREVEAYGVNAAAGGFSGQVGEALSSEMKASWGPLAYIIGAATTFPDLREYDTYLRLDGREPERVRVLNIIVANGRTVAGGRRVAPLANPQDGMLDVVVIRDGSVVELADVAARLVAGKLAESKLVETYRARRVAVRSEPGIWFNLDGELKTKEPVEFEVIPAALQVVVGDEYVPVVEP